MPDVLCFPDERRAAKYWLENREPRGRSVTDYEVRAGMPRVETDAESRGLRQLVAYDAEPTLRAIERALEGIADEWCGALLVALGWGALVDVPAGHPRSLRGGPWLARAALPERWARLPAYLTKRGLWRRREQFREGLAAQGVLDRGEVEAWARLERGEYGPEFNPPDGGEEVIVGEEKPLVGWKEIAEYLGCSVRTAREYADSQGLPVSRRGGAVRAYRSALRAWVEAAIDD